MDARDLATLERRGESAGTITGLGAQWIGAHRGWRAPMTTAFIDGLKGFTPTRGLPRSLIDPIESTLATVAWRLTTKTRAAAG